MKKLLLLLLFPLFTFAQYITSTSFCPKIKDPNKKTRSLTVLDQRKVFNLGTLSNGEEEYKVEFKNGLPTDIENWFKKYNNKPTGTDDIILVVDVLEHSIDSLNKKPNMLHFKGAAFYKKDDKYYFISRADEKMHTRDGKPKNTSEYAAYCYEFMLSNFLLKIYGAPSFSTPLTLDQIKNNEYENLINSTFIIYKKDTMKEGAYKSFRTLMNQIPAPVQLEKDDQGNLKKITFEDSKVKVVDYYAVVVNNKIYRVTYGGLREILEDERGKYIHAQDHEIFANGKEGASFGAKTGGLMGLAVGGLLDEISNASVSSSTNPKRRLPEEKVYIDFLTGDYIID